MEDTVRRRLRCLFHIFGAMMARLSLITMNRLSEAPLMAYSMTQAQIFSRRSPVSRKQDNVSESPDHEERLFLSGSGGGCWRGGSNWNRGTLLTLRELECN